MSEVGKDIIKYLALGKKMSSPNKHNIPIGNAI